MKEKRETCWPRTLMIGLLSVFCLLFVNACGVDDGLGKAGQTEEEFFTILNAPTAVTATAFSGDTIQVVWTEVPSVQQEEGFVLFRSTDGANFTAVTVTPADAFFYNDTGLMPDTQYYYYLRGIRGPFLSDASEMATDTTYPVVGPPAEPNLFVATAQSTSIISTSWETVSDGTVSGYYLRHDGMTPGEYIALGPTANSYLFEGLTPDTLYTFELLAANLDADALEQYSPPANAAAQTFAVVFDTPAAPTNLVASVFSATSVDLTWNDNSAAEEGFEIWRNGVLLTTVPASVAATGSYRNTGLSATTTYNYQVRAYNSLATPAESGFSNSASVTTPTPPAAPTLTSVLFIKDRTFPFDDYVRWKWSDNSTNESGFRIYAFNTSCAEVLRSRFFLKATLLGTVGPNQTFADLTVSDIGSKITLTSGGSYCTYVSAYTSYYSISSGRLDINVP